MTENAHKDKKCLKYDRNFQIKVQLSKFNCYEMIEKYLPKMPRKVKKSKSRNQSKEKKKNQNRKGKSSGEDSELEDAIKTSQERVKIKVPVEILNDKQISMLKLAQSLKAPKFKINL